MALLYSVDVCRKLRERFRHQQLHRPERVGRYDDGEELRYEMTTVEGCETAQVELMVERFVGGGFAGQVYRVQVRGIQGANGPLEQLGNVRMGGVYAMKILIPPSGFSVLFRNAVYGVGFQGPFQLQVNPAAARAGAIWQKFIRRAAAIRFGDEETVNDIHVTFVDRVLGSCGELSDWVEGRTWRLEVDEHLDMLKRWSRGKCVDPEKLGSPEYRAKKKFMGELVDLLHELGAHEFARQYEWSTCKSQPNALKRMGQDEDPGAGLTAVDFRAGLALLPFLPMSPGDFKLIVQGMLRGSLVQFDRGDLDQLEGYVNRHSERFADMRGLLGELKNCEDIYRNSLPDVTHNGPRLLYSGKLWSTMLASAITGWRVRDMIDERFERKLRDSRVRTLLFGLLGLIPILGRVARKAWGHQDWRRHYGSMLRSWDYFKRAVRGRIVERVLNWYRKGHINEASAQSAAFSMKSFVYHKLIALIPIPGMHRFLTDSQFRRTKMYYVFVHPIKLYFSQPLREEWMRQMVKDGQRKHILSKEEADTILSQMDEPYIQRYLISLVVHLLTLPVTQVVSVIHAGIWNWMHPEAGGAERAAISMAILAAYQLVPVSPGSFCRGAYTTALAIYDRNFKDYNIALFLSYFKYVGYLAFPIQMSYRYPTISRFMAGHWATDAVHVVPVFGEHGALLERWVFNLFYNWPLTIRRRMNARARIRGEQRVRVGHLPVVAAATAAVLALGHYWLLGQGLVPERENKFFLSTMWYGTILLPILAGAAATLWAGGMKVSRRILSGAGVGIATGIVYSIAAVVLERAMGLEETGLIVPMIWRVFAFAVLTTLGVLLTELLLPDPEMRDLDAGQCQPVVSQSEQV